MTQKTSDYRFLVAQKGAREHYTVPRSLHALGWLGAFYTDYYNCLPKIFTRVLSILPIMQLKRILARRIIGIPKGKLFQVPLYKLITLQGPLSAFSDNLVLDDRKFVEAVLRRCPKSCNAFWGFSSASLELLKHFKEKGLLTILDQVSPGKMEWDIVKKAVDENPIFGAKCPPMDSIYARCAEEWAVADIIVVNSNWSKHCLLMQGVDVNKIHVIPLSIDISNIPVKPIIRKPHTRMKFLWLGTVNIRKGIHLLIEACRKFEAEIEVSVYGSLQVCLDHVCLPSNITFYGAVARSQIYDVYSQHDVFVLPTLSDGFAITQLEAQKMGLPLLVTDRCGEVVIDGYNGKVISTVDEVGLVKEIEWFLENRDKYSELSKNSYENVKRFSEEEYSLNISKMLIPC